MNIMKKKADSRQGHVVTTVSFSPDLHRRLAIAALEEQMALVELIRQAAIEWLARRSHKRKGRVRA